MGDKKIPLGVESQILPGRRRGSDRWAAVAGGAAGWGVGGRTATARTLDREAFAGSRAVGAATEPFHGDRQPVSLRRRRRMRRMWHSVCERVFVVPTSSVYCEPGPRTRPGSRRGAEVLPTCNTSWLKVRPG